MPAWSSFRRRFLTVLAVGLGMAILQGVVCTPAANAAAYAWLTWTGEAGNNSDYYNVNNWRYSYAGEDTPPGGVTITPGAHPASVSDLQSVLATGRWGFTGEGGWAYNYAGSPNYPSSYSDQNLVVSGNTLTASYPNEITGAEGPGYHIDIGINPSTSLPYNIVQSPNGGGQVGGDMRLLIQNGGSLSVVADHTNANSAGATISDNQAFPVTMWHAAVLAAGGATGTNGVIRDQYPNSITVTTGGYFKAGAVFGFFSGGSDAGTINLNITGKATVNLSSWSTGYFRSLPDGTSGGWNSPRGGSSSELTLTGYDAATSVSMGTLQIGPALTNIVVPGTMSFKTNPGINVVLDSTVSSYHFDTVQAGTLEIDPSYTPSAGATLQDISPNLNVTLSGYTPILNDVIPIVAASVGIQNFDGTQHSGALGAITVNNNAVAWGGFFNLGTQDPHTHQYPYQLQLLDHDPNTPANKGMYLLVTQAAAVPEPSTIALLGCGLGLLFVARARRRRAS